jgi:hypothetical protein
MLCRSSRAENRCDPPDSADVAHDDGDKGVQVDGVADVVGGVRLYAGVGEHDGAEGALGEFVDMNQNRCCPGVPNR